MSLLKNPDFEAGQSPAPWDRQHMPDAVDLEVITDPGVARTGSNYLQFRTALAGGSISQDITVTAPSVTALAYVRGKDGSVTGSFAIWDLGANVTISAPFTADPTTWTQVVVMLGMKSTGANRPVRIELYQDKPNLYLRVDSVTAF
jgi:hypothetical protein